MRPKPKMRTTWKSSLPRENDLAAGQGDERRESALAKEQCQQEKSSGGSVEFAIMTKSEYVLLDK